MTLGSQLAAAVRVRAGERCQYCLMPWNSTNPDAFAYAKPSKDLVCTRPVDCPSIIGVNQVALEHMWPLHGAATGPCTMARPFAR